jgi:hypothetical protein
MSRQRPTAGLTGVGGVAGARVPGCWGVHLRGSVPPADERGRTVSCSREATVTKRCAGQTRSRARDHPPRRVGQGRVRFTTSIMLKATRAMSAVTCLAAVVVRRDDVCFGSGWVSRACGSSPTTTPRWTPWCSMWRRWGSETARSRVTAYPDKLPLNHPIAGGSKGSKAGARASTVDVRFEFPTGHELDVLIPLVMPAARRHAWSRHRRGRPGTESAHPGRGH